MYRNHKSLLKPISPSQAAQTGSRFSPNQAEWCYLGTSALQFDQTRHRLKHLIYHSISDELDTIADQTEQPFLEWLARIGAEQDVVNWAASRMASRSPLQTDLFLLICFRRLCDSWRQVSPPKPRVIVIEDTWLRYLVEKDAAEIPHKPVSIAARLRLVGRILSSSFRVPVAILYASFQALRAKVSVRNRIPPFSLQKADVLSERHHILLYTEIDQRSFSDPETLQDYNTGHLKTLLRRDGYTVTHLLPLNLQLRYLNSLLAYPNEIVLLHSFFRMRDVLGLLSSFFWIRRMGSAPHLMGRDMRWLLIRELLDEWGHASYLHYRLTYLAACRFATLQGHRFTQIIYPFENLPWEKLVCLAFKKNSPKVERIGYQHSSIPHGQLNFFLAQGESQSDYLPDHIVVSSPHALRLLLNHGYSSAKLEMGGAWRYEHLRITSTPVIKAPRQSELTDPKTILVAFPISRPYASRLLVDLLNLNAQPNTLREYRFLLKCHPWLPLNQFNQNGKSLPNNFEVTPRPLTELWTKCDLFLYVGPTTASWEALLAGLPVLKYCCDLLDIDLSHPLVKPFINRCTGETLGANLLRFIEESGRQMDTHQRQMFLDDVFGQVNPAVWSYVLTNQSTMKEPLKYLEKAQA